MKRVFTLLFWIAISMGGTLFWLLGVGFSGWHWYPVLLFVPLVGAPLFFLFDTVRDWIKGHSGVHRSS